MNSQVFFLSIPLFYFFLWTPLKSISCFQAVYLNAILWNPNFKKKKKGLKWDYFFLGINIPLNTARIPNINPAIGTPVGCIGIVLVVVVAFTVVELFPVEPSLPLFGGFDIVTFKDGYDGGFGVKL